MRRYCYCYRDHNGSLQLGYAFSPNDLLVNLNKENIEPKEIYDGSSPFCKIVYKDGQWCNEPGKDNWIGPNPFK